MYTFFKVDIDSPDITICLTSNDIAPDPFEAHATRSEGVIPWSPPQPNWNPWLSINIDEGPLATVRF